MEVAQAFNKFECKFANRFLGKLLIFLHEFKKVASRTVFEDDPEVVARFVPIIKF
jgi:hypothetical protein